MSGRIRDKAHPELYDLCGCGYAKRKVAARCWGCYVATTRTESARDAATARYRAQQRRAGDHVASGWPRVAA